MRLLPIATTLALLLPAAAPDPVPHGRLPDAARPAAYRIELTILPDKPRFTGHVEVDVDLKAPATSLYMHGRDLSVSLARAVVGGRIVLAHYTQVDPLGVARLDFASPLPAGRATLVFDYDAPFGDGASGLYHIKVGDRWYAWSQFESIDARAAFPGFDEPGFKTPFTVAINTAAGESAVSNAREVSALPVAISPGSTAAKHARATGETVPAGYTRHVFETTRPLPTYLVAFAVGPFAIADGSAPPTPQRRQPMAVRVVATREQASKLAFARDESPKIVALLEKYFDRPFPFPKLDQIASPVMSGAMENAGADIYGDNILLFGPGATTRQKQEFGMVVAHELSHQWFGDLVTPDWWGDIWLNESFANWMGYRIGNEWRPDLNIGVGAIDEALTAMDTDALKAGRPIHQAIETSGEIDAAFDAVTYGKGGQVVAMIAAYLGDEKFRDGVRLHMNRHAYGNATSDQFFAALAEAAHDPRVIAAMKSFVDQQGVPVVTLARSPGGRLTASQARYALLGTDVPPQTWTIPLCLRAGERRSCTLLEKPSTTLSIASGPVMPNAGGQGYYRFDMPEAEWRALLQGGPTMAAGEALAVTDSLWASFRAGKTGPSLLVEAARRMAANPDSNVATDGGDRIAGLRARGLIPAAAMPNYRRLMATIYEPRLRKIGFRVGSGAHAGDPPDRQKLRAALVDLVADEARDPEVRAVLDQAAAAYLAGDAKALDQAFLTEALTIHVQDRGVAAVKPLYEAMLATKDSLFRSAARAALGKSGDPATAKWLLAQMGDQRLRKTDKSGFLRDLMQQAETRDAAYDWLIANFDSFGKSIGIFEFNSLMTMPARFCSAAKSAEIERTLRPRVVEAERGALSLDRTVEQVHACGLLQDAKGSDIAAALGPAA